MRILHLIDHMGLGGAQFMVKGILEKYKPEDHYVFSLKNTTPEIKLNFKNYNISSSKNKYSLKPLFELKNYIKTNNIKLVHAYLFKSQIFAFFLKFFFFPKLKIISHELGEVFVNDSIIYKLFLRFSAPKFNLFLAASKATKLALIEKGKIPENKIHVVDNYIILADFKTINKQNTPQKSPFTIGYAGRLSAEKGCIHLINAVPHIKTEVIVKIAGVGSEKINIEQQINKLNISSKVEMLGFVKDMQQFYSNIDLLVIPSEHESFGLIAIEAQAMGVPVIASNIPGLNEVVINNENGLSFEPKNHKQLAQKIDLMFNDNNLRAIFIENGYKNAAKYDIEPYFQKLMQHYKSLEN